MSFWETEFPRSARFGASGGPGFSTTVNESYSGYEQRNRNWAQSRGKWSLVFQTRNAADFLTLQTFFLAVGGKADAFRLYWPADYSASAQACSPATGDGANKVFQLQKKYGPIAGRSYTRTIKKPITSAVVDWQGNALANTVTMRLNGVAQSLGAYTVDATTGLVTFITAPGAGVSVTADFQFHWPVRFDVDDMSAAAIEESKISDPLITWSGISLVEVRL